MVKLNHYDIRGMCHDFFKKLPLSSNTIHLLPTKSSDTCPIEHGVIQGSSLGPLFFLIYINDIFNSSKWAPIVLFADNTNIFVSETNKNDVYKNANQVVSDKHNMC